MTLQKNVKSRVFGFKKIKTYSRTMTTCLGLVHLLAFVSSSFEVLT